MLESVEWLRMFMLDNPSLGYLIVFFGAAFLGESILFLFGFLATQGVISVFSFVFLSFLGTLFSNTIWFILGKTNLAARIISHRYTDNTLSIITQAIYRVSQGSHFFALVIAKFIVGTPFVVMLYVQKTNIALWTFLCYETLVIFLWLIVVIPISLVAGFGFTYFAEILQNLYAAVGFVLLIILTIVAMQLWVKRVLTNKIENDRLP